MLIWLLIVLVIFGVVWWAITQIPLPPPMRVVANVVFAIAAILVLLYLAQSFMGAPPHFSRL
jgi:hypothetical protein